MTMKKIGLLVALLSLSVFLLSQNSLSLFTTKGEAGSDVVAGNIDIELSSIDIEGLENISPGDGDPGNPRSLKTKDHPMQFEVKNNGKKSVKTKQKFLILANDGKLDPRHLMLLDTAKKEFTGKIYITENGRREESLPKDQKILAIEYTVDGDSFEGYGETAEKEDNSKVVKANSGRPAKKEYTYYVALSHLAGNAYQNVDVQIQGSVHAIQYRHTEKEDFERAFTVEKRVSASGNEFSIDFIPSNMEDKDGNRF